MRNGVPMCLQAPASAEEQQQQQEKQQAQEEQRSVMLAGLLQPAARERREPC
jgi:DNA-binding TFAR19-related protein (PDSD5 family)